MAFLDDIYLVSQPERTAIAHRELGHQLWTRAGISLHAGKTQIWNKSGRCPPGCEGIFEAARVADPNAVWSGKATRPCPQTNKGLSSWGRLRGMHTSLPENCRPRQRSTQFCSAGFLLCRISSARGFCCCFVLPRGPTISFGWCNLFGQSDSLLLTMRTCGNCTKELLDIEGTVRVRQLLSLPLALGRLGLRSAIRSQTAAYWASWADSLPRKKGIPALWTLSGSPQQSSGCSNLQGTACGCRIRCPRVEGRCQRAETRQIPREQGPHRTTFRVAMFGQR